MSSAPRCALRLSLLSLTLLHALGAWAQDTPNDGTDARNASSKREAQTLDEVSVIGQAMTYAKAPVTREAIERKSILTSVNGVLNETPGVLVTEADAFGSSDWGTQISMRGFVSNRDSQQIGTTIDGVPNGGSGYGGGARGNRYIDVLDLETVEVSQGTADIASRSNEALGGTLNFLTSNPLGEQRVRLVAGGGDQQSRKYYVRWDTPTFAQGTTAAWISASSAANRDWVDGAGLTKRDHLSAKLVSDLDRWTLTGYLSYDDADESEYASVSLDQFRANPEADALIGTWNGIPYIDQNYRSGSRALRENTFGYLKAEFKGDAITASATGYAHRLEGRGDWIPPYLVDATDDGAGNPQSEYTGGSTAYGPREGDTFYYVDGSGRAAQMIAGCTGAGQIPAEADPSCYPAGSIPVQSYRHSHYDNRRVGVTGDIAWTTEIGAAQNTVRAGVWLERVRRSVVRDWHKLTDATVGPAFDAQPYWVQFKEEYETDEQMYYVEDVVRHGPLAFRAGVKQFFVDQTRDEVIAGTEHSQSDSKSDPLFSAGVAWTTPVEGMEVFGGYSQNFAAIPSGVLGQTDPLVLSRVKPETADNIEMGLRVNRWPLMGSITLYDIRFDNRIVYVPANFVDGIDYIGQVDGVYENFGGVHARGVEAQLGYGWDNGLRLTGSYTFNRAEYLGSGSAERDAALGIVEGSQVQGQPRHSGVVSLDWANELWKAGMSSRYIGERYTNAANSERIGAVVVTDAHLGASLSDSASWLKGVSIDFTVSNLTNRRYLAGVDGAGYAFPAAPRTVGVSVTVDL
jgi:outer membrane receptor for Fe3+-dicitrate